MTLLRQFTAAIFSIHALIGCCWHHAHACEAGRATEAYVAHAEHDGHSPHGDLTAATFHGGPCDDSQHEHGCQGDRCFFVRAKAVQLPPLPSACVLLADINLQQAAPIHDETGRDLPSQGGWPGASLRPHLLHQVLLI